MVIKNMDEVLEKYLYGLEDDGVIDGYKLEDLENNTDFMIQAIKHPLGSKMYIYASENVKCDPLFIRELVPILKDDVFELLLYVKNFLINQSNDVKEKRKRYEDSNGKIVPMNLDYSIISKEIIILLNSLIDEKNNAEIIKKNDQTIREFNTHLISNKRKEEIDKMKNISSIIKLIKRLVYEIKLEQELLFNYEKEVSAYELVLAEYEESPLLQNFFTNMILDDIFLEQEDIEENIHTFYKAEKLKNINTFMVDYIRKFDPLLANHVGVNLELLDPYKPKILRILNNWNFFEEKKKKLEESQRELKRLKVIDDAKSYIEANGMYVFDSKVLAIISIAAKELNTAQDLYDSGSEHISCLSSKQDITFKELGLYNYIKEKIKKYYIDNVVDDLLEESYYEEHPSDGSIRVKFGK